MRTPIRAAVACVAAVGLAACASGESKPGGAAKAYDGPRARIAVADFEDKSSGGGAMGFNLADFAAAMGGEGYGGGGVGRGMADMLVTALFQTSRYILLERQKIQALLAEQDLGASGRVKKGTAASVGEIQGSDLLITGAITGFDPGVSGSSGGIMSAIPIVGSLAGSRSKAYVAMDLRVIDTRTSQIVAVTNVSGTATSYSGSGSVVGGVLGGSLSGYKKTPMETAIRRVIGSAVEFVIAQTPSAFYRYTATGEPIGGPAPQAASSGAPAGQKVSAAPAAALAAAETASLPGPPASPPSQAARPGPTATQPGSIARLLPGEAKGEPPATRKALQSIRADADDDLVADLNQVTRRGTVLTVVVSLSLQGSKAESEQVSVHEEKSHVMDYATGQSYPVLKLDGFVDGRLKPGDRRILRAFFKIPPEATSAAITLSGIGTFDDVKLGE